MSRFHVRAAAVCLLFCAEIGFAQYGRGGGDWMTSGADAQRTSWVKTDPQISVANVKKGVMKFLWKLKLNNASVQLNGLTTPAVASRLITYKGFKDLIFLSGSGDNVYSIDHVMGKIFWETHLPFQSIMVAPPKSSTPACPGGLTAAVAIPIAWTPPAPPAPPAAPAPGALVGGTPRGPGNGPTAATPPAAPAAPPRLYVASIYALSSDGLIHTLNQHTGGDMVPAARFLHSNAQAQGLLVVNDIAYTATSDDCGGVPNALWAIDLASNKRDVREWKTGGAGIAGSASLAFSNEGTIFTATEAGPFDPSAGVYSSSVVALDPATLNLKDWFSPAGNAKATNFGTTPVVFKYKDKEYVVDAGQEGRLYLLDAASLGGPNHDTPVSVTAAYGTGKPEAGSSGLLASWEDDNKNRWVLASLSEPLSSEAKFAASNGEVKSGTIVAFKLIDQNGKPALQPMWTSRDLISPAPPVIVNGVVFALSRGEFVPPAGTQMSAEQRAKRSVPAVLYAFDALTGAELWNSGKTIQSFSHEGISAGASKVYVSTVDGTLYAFGYLLPRE